MPIGLVLERNANSSTGCEMHARGYGATPSRIEPGRVVAAMPAAAAASNPIVTENQNAGTDAWQVPEPTACAGGLAIPDCATSPPTTRTAERREIEALQT